MGPDGRIRSVRTVDEKLVKVERAGVYGAPPRQLSKPALPCVFAPNWKQRPGHASPLSPPLLA